jgi:hypothetical protein
MSKTRMVALAAGVVLLVAAKNINLASNLINPANPNASLFTPTNATQVPELDPGFAGGALTLIAGGLAVLRGRVRRK